MTNVTTLTIFFPSTWGKTKVDYYLKFHDGSIFLNPSRFYKTLNKETRQWNVETTIHDRVKKVYLKSNKNLRHSLTYATIVAGLVSRR